jgi:hypothetical protein
MPHAMSFGSIIIPSQALSKNVMVIWVPYEAGNWVLNKDFAAYS